MTHGAQGSFDREGRPISEGEFRRLHADAAYRVVRQTTVLTPEGRGVHVVTSWLGTDQGDVLADGRPLLFGTIARDSVAGAWRNEVEHFHATEDEALAYHEQLVAELGTR